MPICDGSGKPDNAQDVIGAQTCPSEQNVNSIPPIQQNPFTNGYDKNTGYDESYENKCATNYSIITNNNWNDTHNKQLTMHNKYTNDDVDFDDCVAHACVEYALRAHCSTLDDDTGHLMAQLLSIRIVNSMSSMARSL